MISPTIITRFAKRPRTPHTHFSSGSSSPDLLRWMMRPAALMLAVSCAGCDFLTPPAPAPLPVQPTAPPPNFFDPAAGYTKLTALNEPGSAKLPDKFSVQRVETGELLWVQSVDNVSSGTPPREQKSFGQSNVVRLAGIITPAPNQPGYADTIKRIQKWVQGQEVDVEQDTRFPVDLNNRPWVQVFFTARKGQWQDEKIVGQRLLLNRMLVRTGYAVVDFNSPTTIDVKPWLNDEQFAQKKGLGLWGLGIVLGQRLPPPMPANSNMVLQRVPGQQSTAPRLRRRSPRSSITMESAPAPNSGDTTTQTTTNQTTNSASPSTGNPAVPPSMPPGAAAPSGAGAPAGATRAKPSIASGNSR